MDSFNGRRQVATADGVNGAVIANNDIFVTWDLNVVAAA